MTGDQAKALQDALLNAFPNEDALRELLLFKMDLKLPEITEARSLRVKVLDVIQELDGHGRLEELVARACELRSHNLVLQEVVRQYWPNIATALALPTTDVKPVRRETTLATNDWNDLIDAIREKKCTPVIGPGACHGVLPDSAEIAAEWAESNQYPFADRGDLTRVSQFIALTRYRLWPQKELHRRYSMTTVHAPDFDSPDEPHALLADLDLPLYLTTNYDDFMQKALASRRITATRAFPRWTEKLRAQGALDAKPADTTNGPLVYHLFGHHEVADSLVLTEDNSFEFFASVVANEKLFPPIVKTALAETTLLFIGYGILDWSFRVLVHALLQSLTAQNPNFGVVAVQLPPETLHEKEREQVEKYLKSFLETTKFTIRIFWGDTRDFTRELRTRWEEQGRHAAAS